MLSREQVLRQGLDLNLGGIFGKGDGFGKVLDLVAQRSLQCFCVV